MLEEGPLLVELTAAGHVTRKPWAFKWWLEFSSDATDALPGAGEALVAECDKVAELMKTSLRSRPGPGLKAN